MKFLLAISLLLVLSACSDKVKSYEHQGVSMSSFKNVWSEVKSDPYVNLPQKKVSYFKLSKNGENIISKNAVRTLNEDADLLEPFEKLAHPNGICFKGVWKIDIENPYSGFFKKGSESLIIARASSAMSHTKSGNTRAFGFAGKLFGTMKPDFLSKTPSANFFLIDDLGGTDAEFYRDVSLTNEPSVSFTMEVVKNLAYAVKVANAFSDADKNAGIRQLYEISSLGESEEVVTPKWMKIEVASANKSKAKDFRNELKIDTAKHLIFNVFIADKMIDEKREWQRVGTITLDESVTSESCDSRLHFHHPKWRE